MIVRTCVMVASAAAPKSEHTLVHRFKLSEAKGMQSQGLSILTSEGAKRTVVVIRAALSLRGGGHDPPWSTNPS